MRMRRRAATLVAGLALAAVPAACGEDDVRDAGREAEDEAGEVKRDAEKKGKEAKKDVEKEIND
jgi:hypothetical protein